MARQRSDSEAEAEFAALYHRHQGAVTAYALRRCSPDDAADVVSETFVVAWRRFDSMPEEPASKPWLIGVARRVLANHRRGNRRRGELARKASTYLEPRFSGMAAIEDFGDAQEVVDALKTLSRADRELLTLSAWEQLTPAEIAVVLGVSSGVVRKRLFRARKRLANAAGEVGGEVAEEQQAESGHIPKKERRMPDRFERGPASP